ncbi:YciI family protein [Rathayibacter sp. KR2-224]|uniref:YciI family protein n=1 Tax=Rathayibacter sp. KR2-224 TaxID=3400913 RepID=UPI003C0BA0BC
MRYMLLICTDPTAEPEAPGDLPIDDWVAETDGSGERIMGERLPAETAKVVRRRGDRVLITDGPFAESKEQIAGFDLIEAESLDRALEIAARHPMARGGLVEVRQFYTE